MRRSLPPSRHDADWIGRAVQTRISASGATVLLALGLALAWLVTYALGGAGRVPPHWFYAPVLFAAARFGAPGALATALAAGLLAGPLTPLDVAHGTAQQDLDWTTRTGFFLANGLLMAAVFGRLRRALSREIEVARQERELARHKEAVIQTVSHEFLTPITVIRGTIETLARRGLSAEEARSLMESVQRSTWRLEPLVKVVVVAADALLGSGEIRHAPVALGPVCEAAANSAGGDGAARVRFQADADVEKVVADPELLTILLQQLIDNALKFSPPTSPVDVRARRVIGGVEIRVSDRGRGIEDSYREHAFESFTQEDQSDTRIHGGLGMGLFAARKIVELMGGSIDLQAREGGGTEAIVRIPQRRSVDAPQLFGEAQMRGPLSA